MQTTQQQYDKLWCEIASQEKYLESLEKDRKKVLETLKEYKGELKKINRELLKELNQNKPT